MNTYKNTLNKVRALLKEDDNLTKTQCECFQWQLLSQVPNCEFKFNVGKGGVNTIFFSLATDERSVCYPDEILTRLETLAKSKVFAYAALDKKKKLIRHSVDLKVAKKTKHAHYVASIDFKGVQTLMERKEKDLHGKRHWCKLK